MSNNMELNAPNETEASENSATNWSLALNIRNARRARLAAGNSASSMDDGGGDGGDGSDGG
ncbi:MAG: hypothetical protein JWM03_1229, partial [Rhodocyclales bacterium]|nr:hypothetical protein [Rhodocyclales bacterium]